MPAAPTHGAPPAATGGASPFRAFEEDVAGARAIAGLRLVGAGALVVGGAWLVLSTPTARALGMALLALLVAAVWVAGFVRARRAATRHVLRLTPEAIELRSGDRLERAPWSEVEAVEVDEDRLVVRIDRAGARPIVIEPLFCGVGVYALADAIRAAREATSHGDPRPGTPEPEDIPPRSGGSAH